MANGNYYTDNDMEHQTPMQSFIPCNSNPRMRLDLELSWPQTNSLGENILNASKCTSMHNTVIAGAYTAGVSGSPGAGSAGLSASYPSEIILISIIQICCEC